LKEWRKEHYTELVRVTELLKFCGEWAVLHIATYRDTEFKEINAMVERIPWTG
jgi:hypothetical protein